MVEDARILIDLASPWRMHLTDIELAVTDGVQTPATIAPLKRNIPVAAITSFDAIRMKIADITFNIRDSPVGTEKIGRNMENLTEGMNKFASKNIT